MIEPKALLIRLKQSAAHDKRRACVLLALVTRKQPRQVIDKGARRSEVVGLDGQLSKQAIRRGERTGAIEPDVHMAERVDLFRKNFALVKNAKSRWFRNVGF